MVVDSEDWIEVLLSLRRKENLMDHRLHWHHRLIVLSWDHRDVSEYWHRERHHHQMEQMQQCYCC